MVEKETQVFEGLDIVGFESIAQTPLRIFPPSTSLRLPPGRELVVVEEGDVQ